MCVRWRCEGGRTLNVGPFWCFAGGDGEWLCSPTFPVSPEAPAGPRTLVLLPTGQHDSLFLLQECCKCFHPSVQTQMLNFTQLTSLQSANMWFLSVDYQWFPWSGVFVLFCPAPPVNLSPLSFVPTDVCSAHLLVSVLLWILRFSHDWPVVSNLLQPDVLRFPTTHHWHTGQRRVGRDSPTTTSALCERPELRGPVYLCVCPYIHCITKSLMYF